MIIPNGYVIQATLIYVLKIMGYLIFARIIISWLPIGKDNPIIHFIYQVTEPILAPVRNLINRSAVGGNMMIDFSPIVVWLLIDYIVQPLIRMLIRF